MCRHLFLTPLFSYGTSFPSWTTTFLGVILARGTPRGSSQWTSGRLGVSKFECSCPAVAGSRSNHVVKVIQPRDCKVHPVIANEAENGGITARIGERDFGCTCAIVLMAFFDSSTRGVQTATAVAKRGGRQHEANLFPRALTDSARVCWPDRGNSARRFSPDATLFLE